jgi:hypothetical protein
MGADRSRQGWRSPTIAAPRPVAVGRADLGVAEAQHGSPEDARLSDSSSHHRGDGTQVADGVESALRNCVLVSGRSESRSRHRPQNRARGPTAKDRPWPSRRCPGRVAHRPCPGWGSRPPGATTRWVRQRRRAQRAPCHPGKLNSADGVRRCAAWNRWSFRRVMARITRRTHWLSVVRRCHCRRRRAPRTGDAGRVLPRPGPQAHSDG